MTRKVGIEDRLGGKALTAGRLTFPAHPRHAREAHAGAGAGAVGFSGLLGSQLLIVDKCDAIVPRNTLGDIERHSELHVAGETTLDQFPTRTGLGDHLGESWHDTLEYLDSHKRLDRLLPWEVAEYRARPEEVFDRGSHRIIRPALPGRTDVEGSPQLTCAMSHDGGIAETASK